MSLYKPPFTSKDYMDAMGVTFVSDFSTVFRVPRLMTATARTRCGLT